MKESKVYRDPKLPDTPAMKEAQRIKLWRESGNGVMSFCDAENCIGKQIVKRFSVGDTGAVFLCRQHFGL